MNNRKPWTFGDTLISMGAAIVATALVPVYLVIVAGNAVYVKVSGNRGLPS